MRSVKSRSCLYHSSNVFIGMFMAAVVAAAVLVYGNKKNVFSTQTDNSAGLRALLQTKQDELDFIRSVLEGNNATSKHASNLPALASDLVGFQDQESADPVLRAADWLINKDPLDDQKYLAIRFALAVVYYNNNGDRWRRKRHWLSELSHCDWYGVGCCSNFLATPTCANVDPNQVVDLDMYLNNLSGEMHDILALFTDLRSLFLMKNTITGTINTNAIGALPNLMKLYLQHNRLTGTVSVDIKGNDLLDTIYVQGNSLTGTWPEELCKFNRHQNEIKYFGLDCGEITCNTRCCDELEHCHSFPETT